MPISKVLLEQSCAHLIMSMNAFKLQNDRLDDGDTLAWKTQDNVLFDPL